MPASWSRKDERQYGHIVQSCRAGSRKSLKTCKRIGAATVNKRRSAEGRTLSGGLPAQSDFTPRFVFKAHPVLWMGLSGALGYLLARA